jgi:dTDP-4-dehydrorhamnose reductase
MVHRLLVTGSTGLVGANLVLAASTRYDVVAGHRRPSVEFPQTESVMLDLAEGDAIAKTVFTVRPTVIVHCAAETRVDQCEDHPDAAMRVNVEGTAHLSRAAAAVGARLVYISTDSVFDGRGGAYTEEDDPNPLNVYARSKWLGEQVVRQESPDRLIIRTNIYGWSYGPKESLAEWVLGRFRRGERVPGFQDVVFSPLLVDDLADKVLEMIAKGLQGLYHVSARDAVSKFDFARGIARQYGFDQAMVQPVSVSTARFRAPRPLVTNLNPAKIETVLGVPMPTVEEGLQRFRRLDESGEVARRRSLWPWSVLCGVRQGSLLRP